MSGCAPSNPRSQLGSGSAHWNLALAVEVWQCPLRSGARGWGWGGGRGGEGGGGHQRQYRSRCCHSDNCCKTMSVVRGIKAFKTHLTCGKRWTFVTCFSRKLAKVYFRHMDAAKEKPCIAKGSRKRWRKGRQNRTQSNGVLATAQFIVDMFFFFGGFGLKAESSNGETTCPNNMRTVWGWCGFSFAILWQYCGLAVAML